MQKTKKRTAIRLFCLLFLTVSGISVSAQQKSITGTVVDATNGDPIIGAIILVEGTSAGTVTNTDGNFALTVPEKGKNLLVSYLGYIPLSLSIDRTNFQISLKEGGNDLDEVVVIGYGSVKKRDLTGAVSSVGEAVLKNIPVTSAASAITGRLAGVSVITSQGSPDASVDIRVRGGGSITQNNSPLFIVDGFQVSNIDNIPPGDIESIDVLKDASSTAIYGAKGANGVILVTTKGGKGDRSAVLFNSSVGFNNMYNYTPVLSPYEYVYLQRELDYSDDAGFFEKYGRWEDVDIYKSIAGNDWQRKLFGNTGVKQNYNLNIMGGDKSLGYSISYTRDDEQYIMQTSDASRDNLNIKINKTFNEHLKLEFNPKMTYRVINGASVSDGAKLRDCVKYQPVGSLTNLGLEDLGDGYNTENLSVLKDPYYNVVNEDRKQTKFSNSYQGALTWNIIKGLSARAEGSYGFLFDRTDQIFLHNTGEAGGKAGQPVAYRTYWTGNSWTARTVLNYKKDFNKQHVDATAGFQMENSQREYMVVNSDYFPIDYTAENVLSMWSEGSANPTATIIEEPSRTESFFARANYIYDGRYYLTMTARADGTNVFAPGHKWGVFPAGSAAWRISEEKFMESTKEWLSNLKLRLSYGLAGNARISSYWRQNYGAVTDAKKLYYQEETPQSMMQPKSVLRNENLSWETKYSSNLGFDFGFLNEHISLTVDLYNDVTKDLIMQVDIPSNSGYSTQYQNLGQTTNKGVELTLNSNLVTTKDFYLSANFNISFNKNRVDKLYGTLNDQMIVDNGSLPEVGKDNYRVIVGEEVGLMYGYVVDGMYSFDDFTFNETTQKWVRNDGIVDCSGVLTRSGDFYGPGHMKLKDIGGPNGVPDGKIDADNDRQIIGRAQPLHTGGFSLQTGYKSFDLVAMFNWSYGNDVLNVSKIDYTAYAGSKRHQNMSDEVALANRFTYIDPATGYNIYSGRHANPELLQQLNAGKTYWHLMENATIMTDYAVEDGSFLRLGNLTLGYTLPKNLTTKLGMKNLRVYGTANNLFCWTNYSGQDPEVNTSSKNLTPGWDYSAYPKAKTYIVGVNLTF